MFIFLCTMSDKACFIPNGHFLKKSQMVSRKKQNALREAQKVLNSSKPRVLNSSKLEVRVSVPFLCKLSDNALYLMVQGSWSEYFAWRQELKKYYLHYKMTVSKVHVTGCGTIEHLYDMAINANQKTVSMGEWFRKTAWVLSLLNLFNSFL